MGGLIDKAFSGWKILLAILIGIAISFWMLKRSFSERKFIESEPGVGDYIWVDGNHNNKVDIYEPIDFQISETGNYSQESIVQTLSKISWTTSSYFWIFAALLFMFGRDFFYILRIRLLTKRELSWKSGFYVIMLWEFASALSPGVVGGSTVAMFILNREKIPLGKATAMVIITLFMDNLFYLIMIPLVFLFLQHETLFPSNAMESKLLSWWFWGGFVVIFLFCAFLFLALFCYPQLSSRFLKFVFKIPFLRRWSHKATNWGRDIEIASTEFKQERRSFWVRVFLSTFASWLSRFLVINALMNAFISLTFFDNIHILAKQLILWLFMLVTPTPGGSGVAEFAFGELLANFSASSLLLACLAIIWRLISYFPYLFIGSFLLPIWLKRTRAN